MLSRFKPMERDAPPPELLMAYLDGELPPKKRRRFEHLLEAHPEWRSEVAEMAAIVQATGNLQIKPPSVHFWDHYWEEIDNRLHRQFGWWTSLTGALILFIVGAWKVLMATTNHFAQAGIVLIGVGFLILFAMVLTGRYRERSRDRYERIRR